METFHRTCLKLTSICLKFMKENYSGHAVHINDLLPIFIDHNIFLTIN